MRKELSYLIGLYLQIVEELLNTCLAPDAQMGGLGCDNMTVILICILNGSTYESLATRCARPARSQALSSVNEPTQHNNAGNNSSCLSTNALTVHLSSILILCFILLIFD